MEEKEIKRKILIPEGLKSVYSNTMIVTHTKEEFCLDFILNAPGRSELVARIFTSPGHLKRIIGALNINMRKYEEKYNKEVKPAEESTVGFK